MARVAYDPSLSDGTNDTINSPISADGVPELGKRYEIPARQGRAVRISVGQELTLYNPEGHQVCDFFALVDGSEAEFLSMEHSRTALGKVYVGESDTLVTNRREAIINITEDNSPGVHDILIACCDIQRYQQLGATGYHDNCADNFRMSLLAIGVKPTHVPSPFNIWMNIPVGEKGSYTWEAPVSSPGDFIRIKALQNSIVVMSACPQDMTPVNGIDTQPAGLAFKVTS